MGLRSLQGAQLHGDFRTADRLVFGYGIEGGIEEPMTHIGWRTENRTLAVESRRMDDGPGRRGRRSAPAPPGP